MVFTVLFCVRFSLVLPSSSELQRPPPTTRLAGDNCLSLFSELLKAVKQVGTAENMY